MFEPKVIDNFLSKDECSYILNFVKGIGKWENGGTEFWENRSLNAINIYNNIDIQNTGQTICAVDGSVSGGTYTRMSQCIQG